MAANMSVEERMAAMEARIEELEKELAVERAKIALNTDGIVSNKLQIHKNGENIEKHHKSLMDLMASYASESYKDQMESFVDPSVGVREAEPAAPRAAETGETAAEQQSNVYMEEPEMAPEEAIEAMSYTASPAEVVAEMKEAGIEVPEKEEAPKEEAPKAEAGETAAEQQSSAYFEEPEVAPEEAIEAMSYTASHAEVVAEMKEAGIEVPEKEEAPKAEAGETAAEQQSSAYFEEPEIAPEEAIEAMSYTASPAEVVAEMKEAGIEVPEKEEAPKKEAPKAEAGETAAEQQSNAYFEEPEIAPEEAIEAMSYTASPAEVVAEMKEAGIEVPGKKEAAPKAKGETASEQTEDAYKESPELSEVEKLVMASYADIPEDIQKGLEAIEAKKENQ